MQSTRIDNQQYEEYKAKMQKIADVRYASAVLGWDQETYLPEDGAAGRGRQLATLSTIAHELFTDKGLGELLLTLTKSDNLPAVQQSNVRRSLEDYQKNKKYPSSFVTELSKTTSACYHAWIKARKANDFSLFEPDLQKMVSLKRKEADLLGYLNHPYDALVDDYEKGANVAMLDQVFSDVKKELSGFLRQITQSPVRENSVMHQHFDRDEQWQFGLELLKSMGFDFAAGRQDISEHPFTTNFNAKDVRITTRIDENDFGNMAWSCIHEGGHALYEQGLPDAAYGLPGGEAASLAIHESQSRLWENCVGRSKAYWQYFYPKLQKQFPAQFGKTTLGDFYQVINRVKPSLIRTEADELTYHFHVMIRYELEKKLITGELQTGNLREAWNEMYRTYLNVEVPDDKRGVLQDVHWSHGSFGYFPTYSLGSFYAAQFFHFAEKVIPELNSQIAAGELKPLLSWLRSHIHQYGRLYTAEELAEKVTGDKLNFQYFMHYAKEKFGDLYGLKKSAI